MPLTDQIADFSIQVRTVSTFQKDNLHIKIIQKFNNNQKRAPSFQTIIRRKYLLRKYTFENTCH